MILFIANVAAKETNANQTVLYAFQVLPLFQESLEWRILTVSNTFNYMTLLHLAKLISLHQPNVLCDLLKLDNSENRRCKIFQPQINLSHFQNNFGYIGAKQWKSVCCSSARLDSIIVAPSLKNEISRLKNLFLNVQSYGNEISVCLPNTEI